MLSTTNQNTCPTRSRLSPSDDSIEAALDEARAATGMLRAESTAEEFQAAAELIVRSLRSFDVSMVVESDRKGFDAAREYACEALSKLVTAQHALSVGLSSADERMAAALARGVENLNEIKAKAEHRRADVRSRMDTSAVRQNAPLLAALFLLALALFRVCLTYHAPLWVSTLAVLPGVPSFAIGVMYLRTQFALFIAPLKIQWSVWCMEREMQAMWRNARRSALKDLQDSMAEARTGVRQMLDAMRRINRSHRNWMLPW